MVLANSRVVPRGWGARQAPVLLGSMNSTCALYSPGAPNKDNPLGGPGEPRIEYEGIPCRVQELNLSGNTQDATGQLDAARREYRVSIPLRVERPRVGWVVRITGSDDPGTVGRELTVRQILYGSELPCRDLVCTDPLQENGRVRD